MNNSSQTKSVLFRLTPALKSALAALILGVAAAGCGAASEEPATIQATEEAAEPAEAVGHEGGIGGVFAEAAGKLDLAPPQKQAIEAIKADLKAKAAPMKEAREALAAALADGIARGSIDASALATPVANLTRAAEAFKPALQDGMTRLHATLDAGQRQKLVESLHQRAEGHRGKMRGGEAGGEIREHMKKLAGELELTSDQIDAIRSSFKSARRDHEGDMGEMKAKWEEARAHMQKVGDAFKSESFDARALDVGKELPVMASRRAEMSTKFLSMLTPVLTAPQRVKLAEKVRSHGGAMGKAGAD